MLPFHSLVQSPSSSKLFLTFPLSSLLLQNSLRYSLSSPPNIFPAARPKSLHQKAPPPPAARDASSVTASRFPCNVSHFHLHLQPTPEIHWQPIMGRHVASQGSSNWQARPLQESPRVGVYRFVVYLKLN